MSIRVPDDRLDVVPDGGRSPVALAVTPDGFVEPVGVLID